MRYLITGGAGFVGSSLARRIKRTFPDAAVVAFDNLRRRGAELNLASFRELKIDFVHGDVRKFSDLTELAGAFDVVVDAAAEPSVSAGFAGSSDYVIETNLIGTLNCLGFARKHKSPFILLSTSRVYSIPSLNAIRLSEGQTRFGIGPVQKSPGITERGISEAFCTDLPRSFYGASKLCSEYLVQEFAYAYGMNSVIFRCGVIAGPGQFGKLDQGVFTTWIAHHYFGLPLRYTGFGGTGKQLRDLVHVDDICDLVVETIASGVPYSADVFNIGGGIDNSVSLMEMTEMCRRIVGKNVPIASASETGVFDVPLYVSDCSKFFARSKWRPSRSVETIVSDTFEWIRANESILKAIFT